MSLFLLLLFCLLTSATMASINRTQDTRVLHQGSYEWSYDAYRHDKTEENDEEINDYDNEEYDEDDAMDISSGGEVGRVKRSTPSAWADVELDLAVGSTGQGPADLGTSYDFTVSITLPVLSSPSPLNIEIFSADPQNGTSSLHICSPTVNTADNVSCFLINLKLHCIVSFSPFQFFLI